MNILTRNSASTLPRALESVRDFAEVVVCDGGSSDATVQIAQEAGCVVISQSPQYLDQAGRLINYSGPRNQMLEISTQKWVFQLDSDEYASQELVGALAKFCELEVDGTIFKVGAKYEIKGQLIQCASTYPISHLRVFNRQSAGRFVGDVNENIPTNSTVEEIEGYFVIPLPPARKLLPKWKRYLDIEFSEYRLAGRTERDALRRISKSRIRWQLVGLRDSLLHCTGLRLPARYETARIAFHVIRYAGYLTITILNRPGRWPHKTGSGR